VTAPPLVVVAGPTGTGKSGLSLDLAESLARLGRPAEIVNADAMQLYRGMDIGTAKLRLDERRGIPHHLFDVLAVHEPSTVADYQRRARSAVDDIRDRGAVPILVGGSGLYISALIHDFRFPGTDAEIRTRLEKELDQRGGDVLWERLRAVDPDAAATIDVGNSRRVIRALEVIELTGARYSASLPDESRYVMPTEVFVLDATEECRPALKERLAGRSRAMFADGLIEEARGLLAEGLAEGTTASRAIGYAQAIAVIEDRLPLSAAVDDTIALTWRYVRRQRSWFARYKAHRLDAFADGLPGAATRILEPRLES